MVSWNFTTKVEAVVVTLRCVHRRLGEGGRTQKSTCDQLWLRLTQDTTLSCAKFDCIQPLLVYCHFHCHNCVTCHDCDMSLMSWLCHVSYVMTVLCVWCHKYLKTQLWVVETGKFYPTASNLSWSIIVTFFVTWLCHEYQPQYILNFKNRSCIFWQEV